MSADAPRILVVDDEAQIVRGLKIILRTAGYTVEAAGTKSEALALLGARPPAALVLDLVLPDGQGVEVCREVRRWSRLPILVLSAVGDEREKVRALDAGADDYVTKPFGTDELLARLRAVLRRSAETGGARCSRSASSPSISPIAPSPAPAPMSTSRRSSSTS
jgi:two-component system KDP operon response regulator KdpE